MTFFLLQLTTPSKSPNCLVSYWISKFRPKISLSLGSQSFTQFTRWTLGVKFFHSFYLFIFYTQISLIGFILLASSLDIYNFFVSIFLHSRHLSYRPQHLLLGLLINLLTAFVSVFLPLPFFAFFTIRPPHNSQKYILQLKTNVNFCLKILAVDSHLS